MFNLRLKDLRKKHKVTQKQLAHAIGLSERNYQSLEYGNIKPSYDTLVSIAEYFDVPIDYLVGNGFFKNWDEIKEHMDLLIAALTNSDFFSDYIIDILKAYSDNEEILIRLLPVLLKKVDVIGNDLHIYPLANFNIKNDK